MKAIQIQKAGPAESLEYTTKDTPIINDDEILIKSIAISINPIDVKTRAGNTLLPKLLAYGPVILGRDVCGTIVDVGRKVTGLKKGDVVFGVISFPDGGKTYAEYVAAVANQVTLKPDTITPAQAAAASLAALTALQVLQGNVKSGDRVLVHAASGGVGHFAVQIAKHWGAYVIGTSSADNRDFVLGLGADEHIDYKSQKLEDATQDIDFVFDNIGGETINHSLNVMKPGATIISLPTGKNEEVAHKAETKGIRGFTFQTKSDGKDMKILADLLQSGAIKPYISHTFTYNEMVAAHKQIETSRTVGKVVVVFQP